MKTIDVLDLSGGKVEVKSFGAKLDALSWDEYRGQDVRIQGCAPTWAHLLVAGRLFGLAARVEFLLDDRADGVPIEIYKS